MSVEELQADIRWADNLAGGPGNHGAMNRIMDAARRWANIHPSRLHEWHTLHIKPASWGLTHPLDCDLTDCAYQTQAESWDLPPDEIGDYRWEHEPALESWLLIDPRIGSIQ